MPATWKPFAAMLLVLGLGVPTAAVAQVCGNSVTEAGETCDDGNTVSGDCCDGTCQLEPDGSACNDGLFCNGADTCSGGACSTHAGDPCPGADGDGNCAETCDEAADNCLGADPNGSACNDGLFCNGADTCSGGACSTHAGDPCPGADGDGNCAETCDEAADNCAGVDPDGFQCDDGSLCTQVDTCQTGTCVGGASIVCTAQDQCHDVGVCNPATGQCSQPAKPDGSACNDGLFCNGADTCSGGACSTHGGDPCPGVDGDGNCAETCDEAADNCLGADPNGSACNDGLFCNGADTCSGGACSTHGGDPCPGADGDGNCAETCDEAADNCLGADPNGSACNDGNLCTQSDTCQSGTCAPGSPVVCTAQDQCHDAGVCNPATGQCSQPAKSNGAPCDDGDPCTTDDTCQAGQCVGGVTVNCSALNGQCTVGVCNSATFACESQPTNEGASCVDGDVCTLADVCSGGQCDGAPVDCSGFDGPCAVGVCNPSTGTCVSVPGNEGAACNDNDICTAGETCADGQCTGGSPASEGSTCNDGNPCTLDETCTAGVCTGTVLFDCSALDGPCTLGVCDPVTFACESQSANEDDDCDDGDLCTIGERCNAGQCAGGLPVDCSSFDGPCEIGICDPDTGACGPGGVADGTACEDGDPCTTGEACTGGVCDGGEPVDCSALDGPCVVGTCVPATGACGTTPKTNGTACDDGNACTAGEQCTAGVCGGGSPANEGQSCDDGSPCTTGESCSAGTCGGGTPINENGVCDDGNPCTSGQRCISGVCGGGSTLNCSALDADCAVGVCNPGTGGCQAQVIPEGTACDDDNGCTVGEVCTAGSCSTANSFCSMVVNKLRLFQRRRSDAWRVNADVVVGPGFDPARPGLVFDVFGSGGDFINAVVVSGALQSSVRGRWVFDGQVPGNGRVRLQVEPKSSGTWRFRAKARATNILPAFPAAGDFRVRFRWGGMEVTTSPAVFSSFLKGAGRGYP